MMGLITKWRESLISLAEALPPDVKCEGWDGQGLMVFREHLLSIAIPACFEMLAGYMKDPAYKV
jgi:hypothetical protein